ncbi:MAG: toxin-antitoxin system protein [Thermaerobacter sp.]|jgi:predicted transcriptional regulator|nr:toxin-antitoxin system protein [Thermaerobacter sp.]
MASSLVRIGEAAKRSLKEIAGQRGQSMQAVLDQAIESYRRQHFLEGLNQDFAALREDGEAWKEELAERAEWETALQDDSEDR